VVDVGFVLFLIAFLAVGQFNQFDFTEFIQLVTNRVATDPKFFFQTPQIYGIGWIQQQLRQQLNPNFSL
jgi:hypothetical protein